MEEFVYNCIQYVFEYSGYKDWYHLAELDYVWFVLHESDETVFHNTDLKNIVDSILKLLLTH